MEALKLASTVAARASVRTPRDAPPTPAPDPGGVDTRAARRSQDCGSLRWVCRESFAGVLEQVPPGAWADPEGSGWARVKQNGMREVWRAVIGGSPYYVKYYAYPRWTDRLKRWIRGSVCRAEWQAGVFAIQAGIPAVRPAGYTENLLRAGRRCALLVTEAIEPAWPLHEFWQTLQSDAHPGRRREDAARLIELLAEMIAHAHQAGFEHLDLHAANILVQPVAPRRYRTVFVDLHPARLGVPVSDAAVVRNLAQLNQWFHKHSSITDRLRFLRAYCRFRNEHETRFVHGRPLGLTFEELVEALVRQARIHAEALGAQRDRRLRRDGRYFCHVRPCPGWRGTGFVCCKHPSPESRASMMRFDRRFWDERAREWIARLHDAPRGNESDGPGRTIGPSPAHLVCKASHSAEVRRALLACPDGDLPVILKRPLARNWRRWLRTRLGLSRSRRAWRIGHAMLHRDVPTARPLLVLERRLGPLTLDSLLATEALPGALDLEAYLRAAGARCEARSWLALKRQLTRELVQHVRRLHERGFVHRDCKAQNILVVDGPQRRWLWIDLDGIRLRRPSPADERRALVRLHVSLLDVPGLTRSDRLRFLQGYLARFGSDPRAWRRVWRELSAEATAKLAARERRRRWKLAHYGRA